MKKLWAAMRQPIWVSRVVRLIGFITVASAILPVVGDRLHMLRQLVPPVFPAAATTGAAAIGLLLMQLAGALRMGKYRAWLVATVLSGLAVIAHLTKGLDIEEALLSVLVFVYLIVCRRKFTARSEPRSRRRTVGIVLAAPAIAWLLGIIWLSTYDRGQLPSTTFGQRVIHAGLGLFGVPGPVQFDRPRIEHISAVALVVLGFFALVAIALVLFQSVDGPHSATPDEAAQLRTLLSRSARVDSLSYFATRADRVIAFAPSGKAALTYRVVGSVSLAAGDPIGEPGQWGAAIETWLAEARLYGWTPAVMAASEPGAEAFQRAGFEVLEVGDEAIVHVADFTLEGRSMKGVRNAVTRCLKAGITVTVNRVADLTAEQVNEVVAAADHWRDGEVERGFSMALDRFGALDDSGQPRDPDTVVVLARDTEGALQGLLHFVPWGKDGLSLDLMRRDRASVNGLVETMVSTLLQQGPKLGLNRVSLNFAVFRAVFARGERLGADPGLRAQRAVLLWLSRFWQIESLYKANAKYQPEWQPRFICFINNSDLARVSVAALRAEAYIVAPSWWRRIFGD